MRRLFDNPRIIFIGALLFLLATNGYAAETESTEKKAADAESKAEIDKPKKKHTFGASVGYNVSSNFADELEPRLYRHKVSGSGSWKIRNLFDVSVGVGYFYKSLGSSISRFPEDSGLDSVNIGISQGLKQDLGHFLGTDHSAGLGVSTSFPMDEESQIEGYQSTLSFKGGVKSAFFDKLFTVKNSLRYNRIFNKFDFSPTDQTPTTKSSWGFGTGVSFPIWKGISGGFGFSARKSQKTDDSEGFNYNNRQSLTYSYKKASLTISHVNGGFVDDGNVDLWFVDKYRRLVSASLGMSF